MKKLFRIILIAVGALALGAGGTFGAYEIIGNETAFSQDAYTLCIGETVGTNGIGDSFLSLDESIVRIDEQGVLTGVSEGNTAISRKKGLFAYYANVSVNDHIPDREADCENPSVCAACGKVLAEAYGHDFTEATCTEDSVCRRCNKLNKLAFGHSFTEATCTEDSHCTTCGFVAGAPLGHDFTLPTCTEGSFCTRCKIPGTENALGHDFIDATCVAPKTCVRCNETEGEPLGHNPAEYVCEKDTLCKRCGEVLEKAAPHQWTEATCTEPETCTVCKKTKGKALGHDYTQATCTKKATCTRCGKTTGYLSNHDYVIKKTYSDDSYTYYDYECSMCKDYFTYKEKLYKNVAESDVRDRIMALMSSYPEGMTWTNDNFYIWNGGVISGGYGCVSFAFILSDAAFGDIPARKIYSKDNLRIGDILRINNDTHTVIVTSIDGDTITIAEGNYGGTIHWGRTLSYSDLQFDYILTRYVD